MNSMAESIILFIFEGKKTEPSILTNMLTHFLQRENQIVHEVYEANIYQLWKEIKENEYIDIVSLLKSKSKLEGVNVNNISQTYIFFDYDGHAIVKISESVNLSKEEKAEAIKNMLSMFNNETENGKLYISYPMSEAIKDCKKDLKQKFDCLYEIDKGKEYKEYVGKKTDFADFRKLTKEDWLYFIYINTYKAFTLIKNGYNDVCYNDFLKFANSLQIYTSQEEKFIKPLGTVMTLSGFPLFLAEYSDNIFNEMKSKQYDKECKFKCIA